jgi:hypothetical protein
VFASWNLASNFGLFGGSYPPGISRMPHACARTGRGETRRTQAKKERRALLYVVMYMNQKYIVCTWSTVRIDEVKCSRCCGHETQDVPGTVLGLTQRLATPTTNARLGHGERTAHTRNHASNTWAHEFGRKGSGTHLAR